MSAQTGRSIVLLTPFVADPLEHGAVVRTHHLGRYLSRNHRVWLVCRAGGNPGRWGIGDPVIRNPASRVLQLFNPWLVWRLARRIRREGADLILVSHFWSALHGIALRLMTGRPLVFDNHNAEYLRFRRQGNLLWPLIGALEWLACRLARQVICVSPTDADVRRDRLGVPAGKLQVLPTGADVAALHGRAVDAGAVRQALGLPRDRPLLLFFGTLLHRPNRDAVDVIRRELAPRLAGLGVGAHIVVAGMGGRAYAESHRDQLPDNLSFTDFVDDIVPVIKAADLVIVPLTAGSGTRFKIIEAIACGRRVVSTTIGAEGLDLAACGDALRIADGWDAFAGQVAACLREPRETTPSAAFVASYDWQRIFAGLHLGAP